MLQASKSSFELIRNQTRHVPAGTDGIITELSWLLAVKKVILSISAVCLAQCARSNWLKFIPTHTSGVICLAKASWPNNYNISTNSFRCLLLVYKRFHI